jgi:undecaprenyl-diphosphatase
MEAYPLNDRIQDLINGTAGHLRLLDRLMEISAQDLVFLIPALLLLLWFWPAIETDRASNQRVAAVTAVSVMAALAVASLIGHVVFETRPFISDLSTRLLINHSADNSFPSDHTTLAFGAAGAMLYWRRTLGFLLLVLATLVGVARIYVGVHWPSDILGAAVIGLITGVVLARFAPLLVRPQGLLAGVLPRALIAKPG